MKIPPLNSVTTANLTFTYLGYENPNPGASYEAQNWENHWIPQVAPSLAGTTTGTGSVGPVMSQSNFSPWILSTVCDTPHPVITVLSGALTFCAGDSVKLDAGTYAGSISYAWSPSGGTDSVATFNSSGTYTVTVTNTSVSSTASGSASVLVTVNTNNPLSVSIGASANPVCSGTGVTYTATPTNGGTSPTYQWEVNGTNEGTNSSTYSYDPANGDVITCVLTVGTGVTCSTGSPATSNSITETVNTNNPLSISISASANPVCSGTGVTYTATPTNGGTSPTYQWEVNGTNEGTNSSTYSYDPANGDVITCVLTVGTGVTCSTGSPATSNSVTETVNANPTAFTDTVVQPLCGQTIDTIRVTGVTEGGTGPYTYTYSDGGSFQSSDTFTSLTPNTYLITVKDNNGCTFSNDVSISSAAAPHITVTPTVICMGSTDTLIASSSSGPTTYSWSPTSTLSISVTGDTALATPTITTTYTITGTTGGCVGDTTAVVTVLDNPLSVSIIASANPVCSGTGVTYTATPTNGGTSPTYQWKVNGTDEGTNSSTYSYDPANGDVITCVLTVGTGVTCSTGSPATSNSITETVNTNNPLSVSIGASANPVCSGTGVTYTATPTNGGTSPTYQWEVNGTNEGTNSSTYSYDPANGDVITCLSPVGTGVTCSTGSPATSNSITETVNTNNPLSVNIGASANPVCSGTGVTYTATPTNGGTSPTYQWKVNGTDEGTNSSTYSYDPANGDVITCVLTVGTGVTCSTGSPATSNSITETVNTNNPLSVNIGASANPVCSGTGVTYTATPTNGGTSPHLSMESKRHR